MNFDGVVLDYSIQKGLYRNALRERLLGGGEGFERWFHRSPSQDALACIVLFGHLI